MAGHYEPLVPLARAALRAGHEVAFATGDPALAREFTAFKAGPGPELRATWLPRLPAREVLATDAGRRWFFTEVFAKLELPPRAEDLRRTVADWRPDVLVHEIAELAGPLVATEAGVPYATAGYGILPRKDVIEPALAAPLGRLYFDPCPPSLQIDWVDEFEIVQRVGPATATAEPLALDLPYERTVYLTMGTVWGRAEDFTQVLDDLADEPINVIVTTGAELDLGPRPPHVHVARYLPQAAILPVVDAVICHGGSGTILGALAHGRPLVVLPRGADQFANAARVEAAGAGLADGDVREVLADPSYTEVARRIARETAAMPPVDAAVSALARVA
jgi:UDP:flavonoid glycosyltransferase YjiC (YdhE family)